MLANFAPHLMDPLLYHHYGPKHPAGHVPVLLNEWRTYLALWVCCERTGGPCAPPLTAGPSRDKFSHSSVAAKPEKRQRGVHVHKQQHSPPATTSSSHMLKNTHTQQPDHNPLPQSTGCNIPGSLPVVVGGCPGMTSLKRERRAQCLQCMRWWVVPDSKGFLPLSLSKGHTSKHQFFLIEIYYRTWKWITFARCYPKECAFVWGNVATRLKIRNLVIMYSPQAEWELHS